METPQHFAYTLKDMCMKKINVEKVWDEIYI